MQNISQSLYSPKTPHILPSRASYGVSFVIIIGKNWPRYNSSTLYWSALCGLETDAGVFTHDILICKICIKKMYGLIEIYNSIV